MTGMMPTGIEVADLAAWEHEPRDERGRWVLTSLNPTGSLFTDYDPASRATSPLGPNLTTLAETKGVHPGTPLRIYRGAPAGQKAIVPGDFITDSPQLAADYAGGGRVLSLDVTHGDVLDDRTEPGGGEYI